MLARCAENGPACDALGIIAHALEILRHHKQLGQMAGALRLAANQIDHHLLAAVVQLVHPVVHGEDALGERRIGLGERLCGKRDHVRHLVGGLGELTLQVRDGLRRKLLGEVRNVARHLVDMRQVADQAKRAGHFPQIIGHQRLLHEHDVKAAVLDGLAQPARRLAAGKHAFGGIGVGFLGLFTYIIIGVFLLLGIISLMAPLPEVKAAGEDESDTANCPYAANKTSIWQFPHLVLGALTLFIYVGVETLSLSTAVDYAKALNLENPDLYAWIPSIGMVIGYICGIILIPQYLTQDMAMRICACIGVAGSLAIVLLPAEISIWAIFLMALGCSLMWPALWPLAMADLGKFTKSGSALLTMAIAGGAVIPTVFGFLQEGLGAQGAYWLALPCFLFILYYGVAGYKIRTK